MKIAVISDVHSNIHGLQAVLDDIETEKPDRVVGAGDMVACSAYAGTRQVWETLQRRGIACVIGNEEQRILRYYAPDGDPYLKHSVQYMPLQYRARQFTAADIQTLQDFPLTLTIAGPQGRDVLVCHASPRHASRSPFREMDAAMEQSLEAAQAQVIVSGHLHLPLHQAWRDRLLLVAGSAGLPLRGDLDTVDYLILTFRGSAWHFEFKSVRYDGQAALRAIRESDFVEQTGPIGWLMLGEALTQENYLTPFLENYCPVEVPDDFQEWQRLAIGYLQQVGQWETVRPYIQDFL